LKTLQTHEDFIEMIDVKYAINNKADIVIRVKEKKTEQKVDYDHHDHHDHHGD